MRDLTELGFERYRDVDPALADRFRSATGHLLPPTYLEFLSFRPPGPSLGFRFLRADGREWEGCVSEVLHVAPLPDSLDDLHVLVLRPASEPSRSFFPITCDAGGNYLYLDLGPGEPTVVDVDYGTGLVSVVAPDFESFLDLLYPLEE